MSTIDHENVMFDLFLQMKKKKIRQKEIASYLNCSSSWVSQCFSLKEQMSEEHIEKIKEYIENKETL